MYNVYYPFLFLCFVFIFPGTKTDAVFNPAVCELAGHLPVYSKLSKNYKTYSKQTILDIMSIILSILTCLHDKVSLIHISNSMCNRTSTCHVIYPVLDIG